MNLRPFHNHELDPTLRELLPERAVGAWLATERIEGRTAWALIPIADLDLLSEDQRALFERDARAKLDESLRA